MTWTRRAFLQATLATAAAALVKVPAFLRQDAADAPFYVLAILAHTLNVGEQELRINAMDGTTVLYMPLAEPRQHVAWFARPGHELDGRGLRNDSTADLEIELTIRSADGRLFRFGPRGAVAFQADAKGYELVSVSATGMKIVATRRLA